MIGICGSHRTGKSTLAREYADKFKMRFAETSVSAMFKDMGYDPAATYDLSTRLDIQIEILKRTEAFYNEIGLEIVVTDRTPLDFIAYTLAEAIGNSIKQDDQKRLAKYVQDCFTLTNRKFSMILVIQPGIKLVEAPGKAALNEAYMEHLNSLIMGLSVDERLRVPHFYMPRATLALPERVSATAYAFRRVKEQHVQNAQYEQLH